MLPQEKHIPEKEMRVRADWQQQLGALSFAQIGSRKKEKKKGVIYYRKKLA